MTKSEKLERPAKVYNLSVCGTPEYFAQGVLVHNCIGAGVAWLVYSEYVRTDRIDTSDETGKTPEVGSFLWRERLERPRVDEDSPEFSIRDVMLT